LLLVCSGCSAVEKNLFLKPADKSEDWKMTKYKSYAKNIFWSEQDYDWSNHQYYSCDSTTSIVMYFSSSYKSLFIGPPIAPIFPIFPFIHIRGFDVRVIIKAGDFKGIENLSKQFHFYFNDSLNYTLPSSAHIITKSETKGTKNDIRLCNESLTNEYFSINLHFNLEPYKLKKVSIKFADEFNKQLNSKYKTLNLLAKRRLYYWVLLLEVS
jgi:hypothetical protein